MLLRCAVRDGWEHELYLQAAHEAVEAGLSEAQVAYFYKTTTELLRG